MKHPGQQVKISLLKKPLAVIFFTGFYILYISKPAMSQKIDGIEELLQEFFIGQTVYPQHKNEIQFTTKPAYWIAQGSEITNIPLQLEYGFTDRFQIELEIPYGFSRSKTGNRFRGIGNTEIGFLYNILKGNKPFALSLAMDIGLPTEKRKKGDEKTGIEWGSSLIVARQIGIFQVHTNFGAELSGGESVFNYNLATVYPFGDWRATLELNGEIDDQKILYITPGLIWKGIDDFEFGLGISKSISKNYASWGVILMITHEFSLTGSDKKE